MDRTLVFAGTALGRGGTWDLSLPRLVRATGIEGGGLPLPFFCPGVSALDLSSSWGASSALTDLQSCHVMLRGQLNQALDARTALEATRDAITAEFGIDGMGSVCTGDTERVRDLARLDALSAGNARAASGAAEVEAELVAMRHIIERADGASDDERLVLQSALDWRLGRIDTILTETTWDGLPLLTWAGPSRLLGLSPGTIDLGIVDPAVERVDLGLDTLGVGEVDVVSGSALDALVTADNAIWTAAAAAWDLDSAQVRIDAAIATLSDACGRESGG